MSDKEGDSSEDVQIPIEFTILQSETKSFQVPPDQDVFFTSAELINIQPDSSNKVVVLSIDYDVVYFHSENSSEDESLNNTENKANYKSNSNQINEDGESIGNENKSISSNDLLNRIPKKALDHIIISIPISSSLSTASDSNSLNASSSTSAPNSNQNSMASSQSNASENYNANVLNLNYNYNTNSMPIQIQFCPEMNPVFHVSGPADVKLSGFTSPSNYNFIEEEEESDSDSDSDVDENIQNENQNESGEEKIDEAENLDAKKQINTDENENSPQ